MKMITCNKIEINFSFLFFQNNTNFGKKIKLVNLSQIKKEIKTASFSNWKIDRSLTNLTTKITNDFFRGTGMILNLWKLAHSDVFQTPRLIDFCDLKSV